MTVLTVVSLVATAVGAGMQYNAQRQQAKAAEAAANYNARIQRNAAKFEADVAAENARRQTEEKRRRLSSMRAKAAGSGVSFAGSVVDQLEDSAFILERNIQSGIYQSEMKQRHMIAGAQMTEFQGQLTADAHRTNANAALIQGATDVAGGLYSAYRDGSLSF